LAYLALDSFIFDHYFSTSYQLVKYHFEAYFTFWYLEFLRHYLYGKWLQLTLRESTLDLIFSLLESNI